MCDKCERDKTDYFPKLKDATVVNDDRLAVLEKDHRAMERLRELNDNLDVGHAEFTKTINAILAEGE